MHKQRECSNCAHSTPSTAPTGREKQAKSIHSQKTKQERKPTNHHRRNIIKQQSTIDQNPRGRTLQERLVERNKEKWKDKGIERGRTIRWKKKQKEDGMPAPPKQNKKNNTSNTEIKTTTKRKSRGDMTLLRNIPAKRRTNENRDTHPPDRNWRKEGRRGTRG